MSKLCADSEADRITDKLARVEAGKVIKHGTEAYVGIDAVGDLHIMTKYGLLTIREDHLRYVHGDIPFESE